MLTNLINKIKALEPSLMAMISLAPFAIGVAVGYLARTPISWALSAIRLLMKL